MPTGPQPIEAEVKACAAERASVVIERFEEAALQILSEVADESPGGTHCVELLGDFVARLAQRLTDVRRESCRHARAAGGLGPRRLQRVTDHIDLHLESKLSIGCLAEVACLSRFHFARAFKISTGSTPHDYVKVRRMALAKALLARDETPLIHIALSCSFSSQANFARAFSRATGLPPGQYRQARRVDRPAVRAAGQR